MNTFEYIKGKPVLQEEAFTFTPDIPVTGSFQFQYGTFTVNGLDAVPGDYPLSMGVAGLRRPHASADGEECSLEMTDSVPFGAEPEVQKRFEFSDGRMAVRTDFILRPSFEMRSITAGGLKVEGLAKLQIAEQVASGALEKGEVIDFAALPDGAEIYRKNLIPVTVDFFDCNGTKLSFELGNSIWRWDLPSRLPGTSLYTIRKEKDALMFYWNVFEFRGETPETPVPGGRNLRFVWSLRYDSASAEPETVKVEFDAVNYPWQKNCLIRLADGTYSKTPCFRAAGTIAVLKKFVRAQLADAAEGDVYAIRVPADLCCTSSAHEDRGKKDSLLHWGKDSREEFLLWANRQLSRNGAKLIFINEE